MGLPSKTPCLDVPQTIGRETAPRRLYQVRREVRKPPLLLLEAQSVTNNSQVSDSGEVVELIRSEANCHFVQHEHARIYLPPCDCRCATICVATRFIWAD